MDTTKESASITMNDSVDPRDREMDGRKRQKMCGLIDILEMKNRGTRGKVLSIDEGDYAIAKRALSCAKWYQLKVNEDKQICQLEISIDNAHLDSTLFEELARLSALQVLDLSMPDLCEANFKSILPSIGLFRNLTLDLSDSHLEEIPDEIENLVNLASLILAEMPLPSLAFIRNMKTLEELFIGSTGEYKEFPKEVLNLTSLRTLEIYSNGIKDLPEAFFNLVHLEELCLDGNPITSLSSSIGKLKRLKKLHMDGINIKELPEEFGELSSLETLQISRIDELVDFPRPILKLKKLRELDLHKSLMRELPEEIGNLIHLEDLTLYRSCISFLPNSIGNLKNLKVLSLALTAISSLPPSIGNLENLEVLYLRGSQISSLPTSFGNLKKLKELNISETRITHFPTESCNLSSLQSLEHVSWDGGIQIRPSIELFQNLEKLKLAIQGNLPKEFGNLKKLKKLSLHFQNTPFLPFAVDNLCNLEDLELSGGPYELGYTFDVRQLDFIRRLSKLEFLKIGLRGFKRPDNLDQNEIDFMVDLVRGTPSLKFIKADIPRLLDYFLACNCFKSRTSNLFASTELPLKKLWPQVLCNATRPFEYNPYYPSTKTRVEPHDAIYKLLVDGGTETFVQVLLDRGNSSSDTNKSNTDDGSANPNNPNEVY